MISPHCTSPLHITLKNKLNLSRPWQSLRLQCLLCFDAMNSYALWLDTWMATTKIVPS